MGNCFQKPVLKEDSFALLNNTGDLWHLIDTNKESIKNMNDKIDTLEININNNTRAMAEDIEAMADELQSIYLIIDQSRLSHQSSSRYGGMDPESIQADLEGPSLINFSTSDGSNARR